MEKIWPSDPGSNQVSTGTRRHRTRRLTYDKFGALAGHSAGPAFHRRGPGPAFTANYSREIRLSLVLMLFIAWLIGGSVLRAQVIRPLQTLSNMVASIREGDFSFRVRSRLREDFRCRTLPSN